MKKTLMKRTLAIVLALVMVLGMFPMVSLAEEVTALNTLAQVTPTEGSIRAVKEGIPIFLDRPNTHLFSSTMPAWLAGQSYMLNNIGGGSVTVEKDGWAYFITFSSGIGNSLVSDLQEDGFEVLTTIASGDLSPTLTAEATVLGREVKAGETLSWGMWAVLIAAEVSPELNALAGVTADMGTFSTLTTGAQIFADRPTNHKVAENLPAWLAGQSFLMTNLVGDHSLTVESDGWLYFLTQTKADSQIEKLSGYGFETIATIPAGSVSSTLTAEITLMGKQVKTGDEVEWSSWAIPLAAEYVKPEEEETTLATMILPGATASAITGGKSIFLDRTHLFGNDIPELLAGKSCFLANLQDGISNAIALTDGVIYMLTPAAGSNGTFSRQTDLEALGFTCTTTLESKVISPSISEKIAVMTKNVKAGDTISCDAWAVLVAEPAKLATVEASIGTLDTMESGEQAFLDRSDKAFTDPLPALLDGQNFIRTNMDGNKTFTATEGGWMYILTLISSFGSASQISALESAGFAPITTFAAGAVSSGLPGEMTLMAKKLEANETVTLGTWGIPMALTEDYEEPDPYRVDLVIDPAEDQYPQYFDGGRIWQGIPSIAKDNESGRLWATWYSGGNTEGINNFAFLYTSNDDGATWTGPVAVADPEGARRAFDPNLWLDPTGRLWWFWSQNDGVNGYSCRTWATYTDNPEAASPTWSTPRCIAGGITMNDPIAVNVGEEDEYWLLPTAVWNSHYNEMLGTENSSNCYISTDKGATWTYQGSITEWETPRELDENMIVQVDDEGTLMMMVRTGNNVGIQKSFSTDKGKTWTKAVDAGQSNAASRFYVGRLSSGNLILIQHYSPTNDGRRTYLKAFLSEDGGESWPYSILIDRRVEVSYPDAQEDADGNIYIIYDCNRWSTQEICMAKITEADIKAGELVTDTSKLGVLINNNDMPYTQPNFDPDEGGQVTMKENLASVEASAGSLKQLDVGDDLFTDNASFVFSSKTPTALIGKAYLQGKLDATGQTVTATSDGYLYVLTRADGSDPTSLQALREQGFDTLMVLARGQLCTAQGNPIAFMEKEVKTGDVIQLDSWAVVVADAADLVEMNPLADVSLNEGQTGEFGVIETNAPVFTNRDHVFTNTPSQLNGLGYLKSKMTDEEGYSTTVTVRSDGWVYMITPQTGPWTQAEALENAGFRSVAEYGSYSFSETIAEAATLYGKEVKAGDTLTWGSWCILIANETVPVEELAQVTLDAGQEGGFAQIADAAPLFVNRDHAFSNVPKYLAGKNYLRAPLEGGIHATAQTEGWVYILTGTRGSFAQAEALVADGYTLIAEYGDQYLSPTVNEGIGLYGKEVKAGDSITCDAWGILIADAYFQLNQLATVLPVFGTPGTVSDGSHIFVDRPNTHVFTANTPYWLLGQPYLFANLQGTNSAIAVESGWVYFVTPISGVHCQQAELEAQGFTVIDNLESGVISPTVLDKTVLMGKEVAAGESLTWGAWALMISEIGETAAVVPASGTQATAVSGGQIFTNRPDRHLFIDPLPRWMEGKLFIMDVIDGAKSFTVEKSGWILAVTFTSVGDSQLAALMAQGFGPIATLVTGAFSPTLTAETTILAKKVERGESISWNTWAVMFAEKTESSVNLTAGSAQAEQGEKIAVDISTDEALLNYAAGLMTVSAVDAGGNALTIDSITFPADITGAANESGSGQFAFGSDHTLEAGDTIATVTFATDRNTVPGEYTVSLSGSLYVGADNLQKKFTLTGGSVTVTQSSAVQVTGVTLDAAAAELAPEETLTLTATVIPENAEDRQVSWRSSDETVATVKAGVVTALKPGIATITVTTADGGFTAQCVVTVTPQLQLQSLATVLPVSGTPSAVKPSEKMFEGRNYVFASVLPDWLNGQAFLRSKLEGGMDGITVTGDGWVYILTPETGSGTNSQQTALEEAGYSLITVMPRGQISESIGEPLAVMGKEVKKGDVISFTQWGMILCETDNAYEYDDPTRPKVLINPTDEEYQDGYRNWQGIPGIAKAENGRLWATWYSGSTGEGDYNWSVLYTSVDDGETWTGPKVVIDPPGSNRAFDPNLWIDPDGRMWFFWNQSYNLWQNVWCMYTENPGDENPTWSKPKMIANGVCMNDPVVLSTGEWLLPTTVWEHWTTIDPGVRDAMGIELNSNCYISADKGQTWTYQGSVIEYATARELDENMIVEVEAGKLMMYIRTPIGIQKAFSTDKGKSWTPAADADVSNVVSRFYISKLSSGNLLLVYNDPPNGGTSRSHMTAALSTDGGETWPYKLMLDQRNTTAYPDAQQDADGNIYVIYDHSRIGENEIYMAKITEADIMAGQLVTEGSKIQTLVNNISIINLSQNTAQLEMHDTLTLTWEILPAKYNNRPVIWTSSNEAVATVIDGVITAVGSGEAVITAKVGSGTDTCVVTVHEHADEDKDHKCDVCGKELSECADADKNHKCDTCGKELSKCIDADKNGKCDICGADVKVEEEPKPSDPTEPSEPEEKPADPTEPTTPSEPEKIENPFEDITEDMFCYDAVLWAYENEITTGKDATHFNPSGNCTRSQVVTFLWRAAGKPNPKSSENPFPDVATGKFYTEAVLWAVENGITAGFKDGTFGPDKTCTRDQIVTFLWRFAGEPEPKSTENTFPDVKADAFYTDAVLWAVENGITTGYKDGTFGPSKTCKRDQIVTFLYRYMVK